MVASMWKDLGPSLTPAYRALALEPRGHGASERPPDGYSVAQFAADLIAFLGTEAKEPAVLIGHSFGAFVATHTAAIRPDLVTRLILVDPSFYGNAFPYLTTPIAGSPDGPAEAACSGNG